MAEAVQIKDSIIQMDTPTYDHIHLTDEEIASWTEWALRKARYKKAGILNEIAYAKKLREKSGYIQMNFDMLKAFVIERNPDFVIDESNELIFDLLCMYFSNDPQFEEEGYSFTKGILLRGPVGCGKTELMKVFALNSFRPYRVISCRSVADNYTIDGTKSLYQYSEPAMAYPQLNFGHDTIGQCFDDLGTEDDKKNFGNQVNVMQDVLYKIYDNRNYHNFHMTTNIGGEEIERFYGQRIRSRLREMFNVFTFDIKALDRRK